MAEFAQAKVNLVNRALLKLGLPASFSIDAEDSQSAIADMCWQGVEARVTAIYDWSFTRKTVKPIPLDAGFENGWQYGFALPGDRVGEPLAVLVDVQSEDYLRDFMIEAGGIYTNITPIWLRYRCLLDPQYFDVGFAEAFCIALASALAVPILQDEKREEKLREDAFGRIDQNDGGGLFGKLITVNRAAQPQGRRFMENDPLTMARGSRQSNAYDRWRP